MQTMSLDEARDKVARAYTALEEMGAQFALSRTPSLARRKKCARILAEGIGVLEKLANGTLLTKTIFFWCDETGKLFDDTDDGTAAGFLEIEQRSSACDLRHKKMGDEQMTNIILSPKDVKELRCALEADERARRRSR